MPGPASGRRAPRPRRHAGTGTCRRHLRGGRRPARVLLLRQPRRPLTHEPAPPAGRPTPPPHPTPRRTFMSVTATPLADAPYAETVHAVELGDYGYSFRPVAPGLFTCPIDVERREALNDGDELRAILRAARER